MVQGRKRHFTPECGLLYFHTAEFRKKENIDNLTKVTNYFFLVVKAKEQLISFRYP